NGGANVYSQTLRYYDPQKGTSAKYSGNISEWAQNQGTDTDTYGFTYDAAGRLTVGTRYAGASTTGTEAFTERGISYDKAGGMLALQRYGQNASTAEDNISLTYNGMRLSAVTGIIGGQSINASFTYDDCGRTTYDGVSALNYAYDQMGALASVSDASTSTTLSTYRHLADGTKYATVSPSGGALIYRGPFTLKVADISASSPSVSFLRAETGSAGAAIIANASGTGAAPYYYVADHIGSIRAIVDSQSNIVERNDYYAYGKRHTTGRTYATLANSQLLFSGKEDQGQALDLASGATIGTSDLSILDFGARHYDPIVPRWTTQDPLAEKYFPINPYAYCAGDPVNIIDPFGRDTVLVLDKSIRPQDNGAKGTSYTAEVYYIGNGIVSNKYRGSSYPNSVSNINNAAAYNTVNEGTYPYNNKFGHSKGGKKGLNIVDDAGLRNVPATNPQGQEVMATNVNVHSGFSDNGNYNSRGSHACITIHPDDASDFFENFNWTNTLETTGNSKGMIIISRNEDTNIKLKKDVGILPKSFYDKFISFINSFLGRKK
ncbi:MAG: RHS repeat-associated core domain-containing protein, partial [Bacteroidales bacterium]|nr:RHS repeat-associated core domain-containing protein [Bacteroidales bacterium]